VAGWLACLLAPSQILDEVGMIFSGTQLLICLNCNRILIFFLFPSSPWQLHAFFYKKLQVWNYN
jgi:hypothetical protein